mmetsp:Transcript_5393/g.12712  ORF Transcript_5393/g.12712 Transcript_5393/m.12712 type:complete len:218 (-) Transcript_5393:26-679(-)
MKKHLPFGANLSHLLERLHGPNLVVHVHDGDKCGIITNRIFQVLQAHEAPFVHRKVGHTPALVNFEASAGRQDAFVLGLGGDNVLLPRPLVEVGHALDRHVVRLGSTRGEENLLGICVDELRHLLARLLCGLLCIPAVRVAAAVRVAIFSVVVGKHGIQDSRIYWRGSLHVQIGWHTSLLVFIPERAILSATCKDSQPRKGSAASGQLCKCHCCHGC